MIDLKDIKAWSESDAYFMIAGDSMGHLPPMLQRVTSSITGAIRLLASHSQLHMGQITGVIKIY